jgi:hypothetical protein
VPGKVELQVSFSRVLAEKRKRGVDEVGAGRNRGSSRVRFRETGKGEWQDTDTQDRRKNHGCWDLISNPSNLTHPPLQMGI